jgi:hypothetical protein
MNDDEMDELLISGARDYNEPNAVPREEMWARISQARRQAARAQIATQAPNRWLWLRIAAAAVIVLATGIVIGRRLERSKPTITPVVVAKTPEPSTKDTARQTIPPSIDTAVPRLREETRKTDDRVRQLAMAPRRPSHDSDTSSPNLAYRLVVLRHLAGSEAMITAFRASAQRGEIDAQMAAWSRELLGTTRLLEQSQVADDPTMRRLLQDLDLVLAQIARYVARGTVDTEELDLIEESINKRGVITKLRSSLPVRLTPAGT